MTGAGEGDARTAWPARGRGGGAAALIAMIGIIAAWTAGWPTIVFLPLTWGLSAAAVWISLWMKERVSLRKALQTAAVSAAAWACSAGCLLLALGLMTEAFPRLVANAGGGLFWGFAGFSIVHVFLLGLSVWFWLLGAVLPGGARVRDTGEESLWTWLRGGASRIKESSSWRLVPLVFGVTFAAAVLIQYQGAFFVRALTGLAAGWVSMRFLAELAHPVRSRSREKPAAGMTTVRRARRRALWGVAALILLMALFYGMLFASGGNPFSDFVRPLLLSIGLGFLIALGARLLAFIKPLYWLVVLTLCLASAMLFQLILALSLANFA